MKSFFYILLAIFIFSINSFSQTSLAGKVTDVETGEPILFGGVTLYKDGSFLTGVPTDIDGFYNFASMDPGTYDVVVQYLGYKTTRVNGVTVYGGQANKQDIKLTPAENLDVKITYGCSRLIKPEEQITGSTLSSEQLKKLPTRNITAIRATISKCFPTKEINLKKEENQLVEKLPSRELNNTIQNLIDFQVKQVDY